VVWARCPAALHRTALHRTWAEDKLLKRAPGLAATVEMKTGARGIISDVLSLSPLARYKQQALRER
jgi:hemolysin D